VGMEFAPWLRKKLLDEPIEEKYSLQSYDY